MRAEPAGDLDGESLAWLRRLGAGGGDRRVAELELHTRLARIALAEAQRRAPGILVAGRGLDDVARRAVDDAMLVILGKLGNFSGESRFMTWACQCLILEVAAQLGHRYGRNPPTTSNTGPPGADCAAAMSVSCAYADLVAAGQDAAARYPGVAFHLDACGPCAENFDGLLLAVTIDLAATVDSAGGPVEDREVLAFDLYGTLVDPIAISAQLGQLLGEPDGLEAARLWRLKQLEYSFRLTAMGQYEDFRWVTSRALDFALASLGARLPSGEAGRLVKLYDHLQPFPDALPALQALAGMGYELAVFSNGNPAMIGNCLANSGLGGFFGRRVSVDEVRAFKPSPAAYRHAARRLSRPAGQVRLVTSNTFDCVGGSAAGMRTAWVNRAAAPFDTIGRLPDVTVTALDRLPAALAG